MAGIAPSTFTNVATTPAPSNYSATPLGTDSVSAASSSSNAQAALYTVPVALEPEQDAGPLTSLRPPPAYRSSWDGRRY